jgi:hypothetical protein
MRASKLAGTANLRVCAEADVPAKKQIQARTIVNLNKHKTRGFETSQENACNTHRFEKPPALIVDKKFCEELIAYFP